MKLPHPYKCDICPATKQSPLDWIIALPVRSLVNRTDVPAAIAYVQWSNDLADHSDATHLCSAECAQRHFSQHLAAIQETKSHVSPDQKTTTTTSR